MFFNRRNHQEVVKETAQAGAQKVAVNDAAPTPAPPLKLKQKPFESLAARLAVSVVQNLRDHLDYTIANIALQEDKDWSVLIEDGATSFRALFSLPEFKSQIQQASQNGLPLILETRDIPGFSLANLPGQRLIIAPLSAKPAPGGLLLIFSDASVAAISAQQAQIQDIATAAAPSLHQQFQQDKLDQVIAAAASAQKQLSAALPLAAVGEIAGGIAHDINNPLQIILGKIQIAEMRGEKTAVLTTIEQQAQRIAALTRGLLMLSRQNHDQGDTFINICDLIRSTVELLANPLRKSSIEIDTQLEASTPGTWDNSAIIQQAILNLMISARKRMISGGTLSITCRALDPARIEICFTDSAGALCQSDVADGFAALNGPHSRHWDMHMVYAIQTIQQLGAQLRVHPGQNIGNSLTIELPVNKPTFS